MPSSAAHRLAPPRTAANGLNRPSTSMTQALPAFRAHPCGMILAASLTCAPTSGCLRDGHSRGSMVRLDGAGQQLGVGVGARATW
ncbi:hypothetical protein M433DRAFT_153693 [Acidomyces richmondensis BFW]|nr:MAG: hypothetical protein FE78DRAFT_89479 [Acidomyces sp. 'richmondensis']KYG46189.1 hypothetical protein M433DRAFT_153693 [Acidomyces richmondensis BFW]